MDVGPQVFLRALLYGQQVVDRPLYVLAPMKWGTKAMESSLKDEIEADGSLLNHAKAEPLSVMAKALHLTGSWYPCNSI